MTAADLLHRAEQRALAVRLSSSAVRIIGAVVVLVLVWLHGQHVGRQSAELAAIDAQLDSVAKRTAVHVAHRDTTKAEVAKAVSRSDSLRTVTRAAQAKVRIVSDSVVAVVTPTSADPLAVIDYRVPPVVVAELQQDRAQIIQDALTIERLKADNAALEAIVGDKDATIGLLNEKVAHVSRSSWRRGVVAGAVAVLTIGAGIAIAF